MGTLTIQQDVTRVDKSTIAPRNAHSQELVIGRHEGSAPHGCYRTEKVQVPVWGIVKEYNEKLVNET